MLAVARAGGETVGRCLAVLCAVAGVEVLLRLVAAVGRGVDKVQSRFRPHGLDQVAESVVDLALEHAAVGVGGLDRHKVLRHIVARETAVFVDQNEIAVVRVRIHRGGKARQIVVRVHDAQHLLERPGAAGAVGKVTLRAGLVVVRQLRQRVQQRRLVEPRGGRLRERGKLLRAEGGLLLDGGGGLLLGRGFFRRRQKGNKTDEQAQRKRDQGFGGHGKVIS